MSQILQCIHLTIGITLSISTFLMTLVYPFLPEEWTGILVMFGLIAYITLLHSQYNYFRQVFS